MSDAKTECEHFGADDDDDELDDEGFCGGGVGDQDGAIGNNGDLPPGAESGCQCQDEGAACEENDKV